MTEPRKPLFGFLWPKPDPQAPVDAQARQDRLVRITPRGPFRLALLIVGTALAAICAGSILMMALTTPLTPLTILGAAITGTALVLVLRGWVVGTFVNDDVVRVENTWRRLDCAWSSVASIDDVAGQWPLLGTPVHVPAHRVVITTQEGRTLPTHVCSTSPDLWLRAEAYDMARLRLERWLPPTTD